VVNNRTNNIKVVPKSELFSSIIKFNGSVEGLLFVKCNTYNNNFKIRPLLHLISI